MSEYPMTSETSLLDITGSIVAAYVSNNSLPTSELGALIGRVHAALTSLSTGEAPTAAQAEEVTKSTAIQIRKSVTNDGLISFIDGKLYKTLKRHLSSHGLDPRGYRERYGLPDDYPMVAPAYAAQRSALAKKIGLGRPGAMAERMAPRGNRRKAA